MRNEREAAIEKLQNALLKLPKDDLIKLLKNTYQAMRVKHSIPHERKLASLEESMSQASLTRARKNIRAGNGQNSRPAAANGARAQAAPKPRAKQSNRHTPQSENLINAFEKRPEPGRREKVELEEAETDEGDSEDERWKTDPEIPKIGLEKLAADEGGKEDRELIDKYLNFGEGAEQLTFRSLEVEIPQLDLRPAQEYIQRKNNPPKEPEASLAGSGADGSEEVLTPTFSPRKGVSYLPLLNNCEQSRSNSSAVPNYGAGSRNPWSFGNWSRGADSSLQQPDASSFGRPAYTQPPPSLVHPQFQRVRMVRRPFYARSRSLQRL